MKIFSTFLIELGKYITQELVKELPPRQSLRRFWQRTLEALRPARVLTAPFRQGLNLNAGDWEAHKLQMAVRYNRQVNILKKTVY
jgi:hypothetical protein